MSDIISFVNSKQDLVGGKERKSKLTALYKEILHTFLPDYMQLILGQIDPSTDEEQSMADTLWEQAIEITASNPLQKAFLERC